jgi:hypothetical protein
MPTLEEVMAAMRETAGGRPVKVEVKGWPELYVRPVLVDEAEQQAKDIEDKSNGHGLARGAARVICDADGTLIFDWRNAEHVALLGRQPWPLLHKLLAASEGDAGN